MRQWVRVSMLFPLLLLGCPGGEGDDDDSAVTDDDDDDTTTGAVIIPWSSDLPPLGDDIAPPRGFVPLRAITHFHSPFSHDACDGLGYVYGVIDEQCLAEMRDGLCRTSIDMAYLSDHPSYGAYHEFDEWLAFRGDDAQLMLGDDLVANLIHCGTGHDVYYIPGIEDDLMPFGLKRHAAAVGDEADALYNTTTADSMATMADAGGMVFQNHPEERTVEGLQELQDWGLVGIEIFNLHAMLDPESREEIYGLDPFGWIEDIGPFTDPEATGEPDLLFAAFFQEQSPNLERWDALLARGPMVGIAATDAHRNVIPMELRDGERPDGFRRNFRWFSNVLLATEHSLAASDEALAAGRLYAQFELFGTPDGLGFWYESGSGDQLEMGDSCTSCSGGNLHLECPVLSPSSPRDGSADPEITATVFRDGEVWQEGCSTWGVDQPGTYRARIDIVPYHLSAYFGDDPEPYLHAFPWVYTNAIRVAD